MTTLTRRTLGAMMTTGLIAAALPVLAQDGKTFALVQINQQALFFNDMNRGAQEAADAAGAELLIFNANNDPAAQNSAIETYIQEGVDGIAVVAIDVNGIMPGSSRPSMPASRSWPSTPSCPKGRNRPRSAWTTPRPAPTWRPWSTTRCPKGPHWASWAR